MICVVDSIDHNFAKCELFNKQLIFVQLNAFSHRPHSGDSVYFSGGRWEHAKKMQSALAAQADKLVNLVFID